MKFIEILSSFMLDAAVTLMGGAFIGAGAKLFSNDIKALNKEKKKEDKKHEDRNA